MRTDGHFDEIEAAYYDRDHCTDAATLDATVSFLAALAENGSALEFATGTGRIALPLKMRGVDVHGIELSQHMLEKLVAKEGGADIRVSVGDMTSTKVDGKFELVYLVFNTISNLTTQEKQVACFENATAHLKAGGYFVIENAVPPLQRLTAGETKLAFERSDRHWGIDEFDVSTQAAVSHHAWMDGDTVRRFSLPFRYVWPSELDLMARIAGLELIERWESWTRAPFTSRSPSHVSVWQRPKVAD